MFTENTKCCCSRLCVISLGVSAGIVWGLSAFLLGLLAWQFRHGVTLIEAFGSLYVGYAPTLMGSVIGGIWAFVGAFIGGIIFAFIYNVCCRCCKACHHHTEVKTTTIPPLNR